MTVNNDIKNRLTATAFAFSLALALCLACSSDKDLVYGRADTLTTEQTTKLLRTEAIAKRDTFPYIKYNRIKIKDWNHRSKIYREFKYDGDNWAKNKTFRTLNRKELRYVRPGQVVVIPDSFIADQKAYSIFPAFYWEAREIDKIIMVSAAFQAYACYEKGELARFAATNSGKERTQTYPGRYALSWKEKEHYSSLDSSWYMPYNFNFHAQAGGALHQFSMPGRPVSHSCLRQFMEDAKWLYYWGEGYKRDSAGRRIPMSGTPLIIIDHFDFSRKRGGPWLDLKSNKDTILKLPEDPMSVELPYIPIEQIPPGGRWDLPGGKERYVHALDTLRARGILRPGVSIIPTKNFNELRRKKAVLEAKKKKEEKDKAQKKLKNLLDVLDRDKDLPTSDINTKEKEKEKIRKINPTPSENEPEEEKK